MDLAQMNHRLILAIVLSTIGVSTVMCKDKVIELKWVHTSDVHGCVFGWDYLRQRALPGGLGAVYSYTNDLRQQYGDRLILSDGGDVLQGQPTSYYYNYIDTTTTHLVADCMNQMHYDVGALGNHDIETGHAVYDRWMSQLNYPIVGANIIDVRTGEPYVKPYVVIEREGLRIAVLGMMTPAIPNWLPRNLWSSLRFDEMVQSCEHWIEVIRQHEHPDILVGLFHSGYDDGIVTEGYRENAVRQVAEQVGCFDLILYGHDHHAQVHQLTGPNGETVVTAGPASMGARVAEVDIRVTMRHGRVLDKEITASTPLMDQSTSTLAQAYEARFASQRQVLQQWVDLPIGMFTTPVYERDAFFGSSSFIDLIHRIQLDITGADISFAAPVSFDARIDSGVVRVSDMFSLYKYENFLYRMRLSGQEVKDFLEMSYALWSNQMSSPDDHVLLLDSVLDNGRRQGLKNLAYNMDSAAGIIYEVDVTQPAGQRIRIHSMADGTPFDMERDYTVAINSYRGNGGGELLTRGSGIPHDSLSQRVLWSTEKDLRYYLMEYIKEQGVVSPAPLHQWRFVPEEWTRPALQRDRAILFPHPIDP